MVTKRWIGFFLLLCFQWGGLAHAQGKSGVSPTVLVLPSGPGSLGGIGENVSANLNMGLMSYPITVKLPQGRKGLTPSLRISYSSSSGSGVMGIGWGLSTGGSVERLTVRGLPTYTNADEFFSGVGELVKVPSSPFYRARYEGSFVRFRWHQSGSNDQSGYWTAEYPDGTVDYYGGTAKGQVDKNSHVFGGKGTYRWELKARVDRNGNRIEYNYFRVGSQLYLESISWVFTTSGKPLYQVRIKYEDRPDPISDCKPGFDLQTTKRVTEVLVTSEGQRIRSYTFAFDESSGLSRLKKVTQYGTDSSKPYPIQFSMNYSEATFTETKSRLVSMKTSVSANFKAGNSDLVDMNGDGLPDVVNTSSTTHKFHMNELTLDKNGKQATHDFPSSKVVTNNKPLLAKLSNPSVQMLDVNGDGFTDMVDAVNQLIYINKGNSKWEDKSESLKSFPKMGSSPDLRFFDYNGDKKIDVIRSDRNNTVYWVNDGKGSWNEVTGQQAIGASFSGDKVRLIDINGDGLSDAVQLLAGKLRYRKYLGYGKWSGWIDVNVPGLANEKLGDKPQFRDINGDGMADMVAFVGTSIIYFVNKNGMAFREGQELQKLAGVDIPNSNDNSIRIADMNGNGSNDIVWISNGGNVTYLELFSERPNLLKQISNGIGQRINVDYGSSVYHYLRDKTCDTKAEKACAGPWKNKMPMPFTVVNTITTWASRSKTPTTQQNPSDEANAKVQRIYYHHGFYDGKEKKFRGFRHVESLFDKDVSMEARKDEIHYNVGDSDPYFHGKLLRRVVTNGDGKVFSQSSNEWQDCGNLAGIGSGALFPIRYICLKARETEVIEGKSSEKRIVRSEYQYDGFGNITLIANLGEKDKSGDEQVTKTTYITPSQPSSAESKWFLRYPKLKEYCSDLNGSCAETRYFYDGEEYKGLANGSLEKGNLVRIQHRIKLGDDKWLEPTRNKFDSYGNLVGSKTGGGLLRTFEWDSTYHRFPSVETVHMKGFTMVMKSQWDPKFNVVVQSTDVDGGKKYYQYDSFGRLLTVTQPGDPLDKPSIRYQYELKAPLSRIITDIRSKQGGSYDRQRIQCFDGLGRTISQRAQIQSGKFQVSDHKEYNRESAPVRLWYSYNSDENCSFTPPGQTLSTSFEYDSVGRLLKKVFADGRFLKNVYEPFKRIAYDEEDNKSDSSHYNTPTVYKMDGLGRIVEEIKVPAKGKSITTKYTFSNLNVGGRSLPATVTFADGSQKKHERDLLGNIVKTMDPDRSSISYTYNADNKVASVTDGRGVTTLLTYDLLQRLLTRQEEGKPETKISFVYDKVQQGLKTAAYLKGATAKVQFPGGSYLYSYDKRGQVILSRSTIMGVSFDFKSNYNNINQLLKDELPDGRKREYQRDGVGRLTSIPGKIEDITYTQDGMTSSWKLGNGILTNVSYDKRNRFTKIDVGGGKVFTLSYTLDGNSNIMEWKQKHGELQFSNSYEYDDLYRLTRAELVDGKEVLTYQQDQLDNITSKTSSLGKNSLAHIGNYNYDTLKVHAVTQAGDTKLDYDKAGSLLQHGALRYEWDFLGRRTQTYRDNKLVGRYWYDHSHRRVIKEENGLHTFYITSGYHIREGAFVSLTNMGNNRAVASWTVNGVERFFDDLAPAEGEGQMKAKPDGAITAADAWLYHASRNKFVSIAIKKRPLDLDLTNDMLRSSLHRLLLGKKEVNHYYHTDHLNSVRAVTDDQGNVVQRKHYNPYGAVREKAGQKQLFSFGFQGTELDTVTQTNAFLVRSLDPRLGRWLSADPAYQMIGGTSDEFNSYGMVQNNPLRFRDLQGTSSEDAALLYGIGGGITGAFIIAGVAVSIVAYKKKVRPASKARNGGGAKAGFVINAYNAGAGSNNNANKVTPGGGGPGFVEPSMSSRSNSKSRSSSKSVTVDVQPGRRLNYGSFSSLPRAPSNPVFTQKAGEFSFTASRSTGGHSVIRPGSVIAMPEGNDTAGFYGRNRNSISESGGSVAMANGGEGMPRTRGSSYSEGGGMVGMYDKPEATKQRRKSSSAKAKRKK